MKIFYLDTETTGVNPVENDIIEIAGIIEIDSIVKEEFDFNVRPHNFINISQRALEINKTTVEQLKTYPAPKVVLNKIVTIFDKYIDKYNKHDKFISCGHVIGFDVGFLFEFFKKGGNNFCGSYLDYHKMDTAALLLSLVSVGKFDMKNIKLETACKEFGITLDNAHNALADVRATRLLWKKLSERIV